MDRHSSADRPRGRPAFSSELRRSAYLKKFAADAAQRQRRASAVSEPEWTDEPTAVYQSDMQRDAPLASAQPTTLDSVFERAREIGDLLPTSFVFAIYVKACAELARAGRRPPRHREDKHPEPELSPDRILIGFDGELKIDWTRPDRYAANASDGSPSPRSYLSPEQLRGLPTNGRSDLFSLALCVAELLVLKRLSDARGVIAESEGGPEFAELLRKGDRIPRELGAILLKSLALDLEQRPFGVTSMLEDLERIGHSVGLQVDSASTAGYMRRLFAPREEPEVDLEEDIELDEDTEDEDTEEEAIEAVEIEPEEIEPEPSVRHAPTRRRGSGSLDVFATLGRPVPPIARPTTSQILPPPPATAPPPPLPLPAPSPPVTAAQPPTPSHVRSVHHAHPSGPPPQPGPHPYASTQPYGSPQPSYGSPQHSYGATQHSAWPRPQESEPPPQGLVRTLPPTQGHTQHPLGRSRGGFETRRSAFRGGLTTAIMIGIAAVGVLVFLRTGGGRVFASAAGHWGEPLPNAVMVVDGDQRCSGARCMFDVPAGVHEVTARADGYVPQFQLIAVRAREPAALNFRLERGGGALRIAGQPEGAQVSIDGDKVGKLPLQLELAPGSHRVRFEADHYVAEERVIDVGLGEAKSVADVSMRPVIGRAMFDVRTPGVDVALVSATERKEHLDFSQPVELDLSKRWVLEAKKDGYQALREPLDWTEGSEKTFVVALDKAFARAHKPAAHAAAAAAPPAAAPAPAAAPGGDALRAAMIKALDEPGDGTKSAPDRAAASGEPCLVSFNSIPVSSVFLDNVRLGVTPVLRTPVRPGNHVVQFAQGDVRKTKSLVCHGGESKVVAVNLSR